MRVKMFVKYQGESSIESNQFQINNNDNYIYFFNFFKYSTQYTASPNKCLKPNVVYIYKDKTIQIQN